MIVIILLWTVLAYNGIVGKDQNVNSKLSEIKNRYTVKLNVLPAMLSTLNNYTIYESGLLTNITALRSQWMAESSSRGLRDQPLEHQRTAGHDSSAR